MGDGGSTAPTTTTDAPRMSDATYEELLDEFASAVVGPKWLELAREIAGGLARRYDPAVYAVAERAWSPAEIEDLVQDVIAERLLRQGQLRYIVDVAVSVEDIRRLLNHQTRRALSARRRRTVVDRLLARIRVDLDRGAFESISDGGTQRWRPVGRASEADSPSEQAVRNAAAAIRLLPTSGSDGSRAPTVFRAEVLAAVVETAFEVCGTALSISDFGRILQQALTSWVPVVLEQGEEPEAATDDLSESALDLEETVTLVLDRLDAVDRVVLRVKLAGKSDSELAARLDVSRPTAAARKVQAFDRLREAWAAASDDDSDAATQRLATEIYLRLRMTSEVGDE